MEAPKYFGDAVIALRSVHFTRLDRVPCTCNLMQENFSAINLLVLKNK
jgi:hypothetical protein